VLTECFEIKMMKDCRTKHGLRFVFYALRCSGEVDTWLGNTILNWIAHRYFEVINNLPPRNFVVTGDDGNGAYPRELLGTQLINTFPLFGFDCKLRFISDPCDLEFCSAKYIEFSPGRWMLCPDPRKILRNLGHMKNPLFAKAVGQYYYSIGYMYHVMFPNFPFFRELSKFLMSITKNHKAKHVNMRLFEQLNPIYLEIFKGGPMAPAHISEDLVSVGLYAAYRLAPSELAQVYSWFGSVHICLQGRDGILNRRGAKLDEFREAELDLVEKSIDTTLLKSKRRVRRWVTAIKSL